MPVRPGQFYAFVLLLASIVTNIAFFAEVREPFLGDVDPTASVKSALSDLDIQAKIAEFYPKILSKTDRSSAVEVSEETQPQEEEKPVPVAESPAPRTERPASRESRQQAAPSANDLSVVPVVADPIVEPLLPPESEPKPEESRVVPKEVQPEESGILPPLASAFVPESREPHQQTVAARHSPISAPVPVVAPAQTAIADQFKPIVVGTKP